SLTSEDSAVYYCAP
nr:immunoglobulin heavy chain junction region [Mus musculus]